MSARHAAPDAPRPGDASVRAGALVFALGVVAVLAAVVPSVLSGDPARLPLVVSAAVLLPLGLGTALVGLLRSARSRRRAPARHPG